MKLKDIKQTIYDKIYSKLYIDKIAYLRSSYDNSYYLRNWSKIGLVIKELDIYCSENFDQISLFEGCEKFWNRTYFIFNRTRIICVYGGIPLENFIYKYMNNAKEFLEKLQFMLI